MPESIENTYNERLVEKALEVRGKRLIGKEPGYTYEEIDAMLCEKGITPGTAEAEKFMQRWDIEKAKELLQQEINVNQDLTTDQGIKNITTEISERIDDSTEQSSDDGLRDERKKLLGRLTSRAIKSDDKLKDERKKPIYEPYQKEKPSDIDKLFSQINKRTRFLDILYQLYVFLSKTQDLLNIDTDVTLAVSVPGEGFVSVSPEYNEKKRKYAIQQAHKWLQEWEKVENYNVSTLPPILYWLYISISVIGKRLENIDQSSGIQRGMSIEQIKKTVYPQRNELRDLIYETEKRLKRVFKNYISKNRGFQDADSSKKDIEEKIPPIPLELRITDQRLDPLIPKLPPTKDTDFFYHTMFFIAYSTIVVRDFCEIINGREEKRHKIATSEIDVLLADVNDKSLFGCGWIYAYEQYKKLSPPSDSSLAEVHELTLAIAQMIGILDGEFGNFSEGKAFTREALGGIFGTSVFPKRIRSQTEELVSLIQHWVKLAKMYCKSKI